jgi:hypothetical protein
VSRGMLHNGGLTVVAAPADTDYTIRLDSVGVGLAQRQLRGDQEPIGRALSPELTRIG